MIELKSFVEAVHRAISEAAELMEEKNRNLLERYFHCEKQKDGDDIYSPRMATMTIPDTDEEGNIMERTVKVPLITLVPITTSHIEKATFSVDFRLSMKEDKLCLSFPDNKIYHSQSTQGHLDIVISPGEPVEGLQSLIDSYTEQLKKQL